jgi:hypothetical protein
MNAERISLSIQYSDILSSPLYLYVYNANGYHNGPQPFRRVPLYPDEIDVNAARRRAVEAQSFGHEVRITNTDDYLVYQAIDGEVIHPSDPGAFWLQAGATDPVIVTDNDGEVQS